LGVKDGDVLAKVDGAPVVDESDVAMLVLAARGRLAAAVTGELWRGEQRYLIVVEQPYPSMEEVASPAATELADAESPQDGALR